MKALILYICTGNYHVFWDRFYETCESNFLRNISKDYFVFTDYNDNLISNGNVKQIYQVDLGWPDNTLKRYHIFKKALNDGVNSVGYSYLFFFNANCEFLSEISIKDLGLDNKNLFAVEHPGFIEKSYEDCTFEKNSRSAAYLEPKKYSKYVLGGINGGKYSAFLSAIEQMSIWISSDLDNDIIAVWHDESHWNKYVSERDVNILDYRFGYPEGWPNLPLKPKILIRDKNRYGGHNRLRRINSSSPPNMFIFLKRTPSSDLNDLSKFFERTKFNFELTLYSEEFGIEEKKQIKDPRYHQGLVNKNSSFYKFINELSTAYSSKLIMITPSCQVINQYLLEKIYSLFTESPNLELVISIISPNAITKVTKALIMRIRYTLGYDIQDLLEESVVVIRTDKSGERVDQIHSRKKKGYLIGLRSGKDLRFL